MCSLDDFFFLFYFEFHVLPKIVQKKCDKYYFLLCCAYAFLCIGCGSGNDNDEDDEPHIFRMYVRSCIYIHRTSGRYRMCAFVCACVCVYIHCTNAMNVLYSDPFCASTFENILVLFFSLSDKTNQECGASVCRWQMHCPKKKNEHCKLCAHRVYIWRLYE